MILLFSHVRTGRWASVMPAKLAETLGLTDTLRAIPIVEPEAVQTIGLVVPAREPMMPITAALVAEARAARRRQLDRDVTTAPPLPPHHGWPTIPLSYQEDIIPCTSPTPSA